MNKVFVKKGDLKLVNGGYLVISDESPVYNEDFIYLQKRAEFIVEFAKAAKGKDFKGKVADDLDALKLEVIIKLNSSTKVEYVSKPTEPKMPTKDKLAQEALAFVDFTKQKNAARKVNDFMQEFNLLAEFEEFGLYFSKNEIVKLNKIYTIREVVDAVNETIELL